MSLYKKNCGDTAALMHQSQVMSTTNKIQWQSCPKQNSSKYGMTASKCAVLCHLLYFEWQNLSSGCTGYDCLNFLFQNPTVGVTKLQISHMSCPFHPFQTQIHKRDGQNIIYISEHRKTLAFESHSAKKWRSLATLTMLLVLISAKKIYHITFLWHCLG